MRVNGKVVNQAMACSVEVGFAHIHSADASILALRFGGSVQEWCDLGFSLCESYLMEAQAIFAERDLGGLLAIAEAQFDDALADDVLGHANALVTGFVFRRLAGNLEVVEIEGVASALAWQTLANLWRAMEITKGDLRMPRLEPAFDKALRGALRLS